MLTKEVVATTPNIKQPTTSTQPQPEPHVPLLDLDFTIEQYADKHTQFTPIRSNIEEDTEHYQLTSSTEQKLEPLHHANQRYY